VFCADLRKGSDFCFVRHWLSVFIAMVESVYRAVRSDSLYKADYVWYLERLTSQYCKCKCKSTSLPNCNIQYSVCTLPPSLRFISHSYKWRGRILCLCRAQRRTFRGHPVLEGALLRVCGRANR